jgi:hypothetical protein
VRRAYWVLFALLELGAIAVFWCFDAAPFMDFPLHAGVMAMRQRQPHSAFLQQYFVLTSDFGGYPLYRIAADALAGLIGPLAAIRAISTIPVVALPLAMHYARRRLYGDNSPLFVFAALILSFGYMTQMGLSPFLAAFPVLIWALTKWLVLLNEADAGRKPRGNEIGLAVLAAVLVMIHAYAFGILVFVMLVTAFSAKPLRPRLLRLRVLLPAVLLLLFTAWLTMNSRLPPGVVVPVKPFDAVYGSLLDKLGLLIGPALTTRTGIDVVVGILIWAAAVLGLLATSRSAMPGHAVALRNSCVALLLAFAILPHRARSFDFIDSRLLPLVLLLAFMAIDLDAVAPAWRRRGAAAAALAATVIVGLELFAMQRFQGEAAGYREVFARIPAESRLLYFPIEPDSRIFVSHPFVHYDKLAFVERAAMPSQFHFHHASGIFPTGANPILRLPPEYVSSRIRRIGWPAYRLQDWDFVLIRLFPDSPAPAVPAGLKLVERRGGWWLYRSCAAHGRAGAPDCPTL